MICCVTGHRPNGFPFSREENNPMFKAYQCLLNDVVAALAQEGCSHFITGMAEGADLDFAQAVVYVKSSDPYVTLEAAFPYPPYQRKTPSELMAERVEILRSCDKETVVSTHYFKGCMQKRNRYMVDKADLVFAIWNGEEKGGTWNTIKYAREKGKKIRYIMLNELSFSPEELEAFADTDDM